MKVTHNYNRHLRKAFGNEEGIRTIYGMTARDSLPILADAISRLGDDVIVDNYLAATEGNAKQALLQLGQFALRLPNGVWDGD